VLINVRSPKESHSNTSLKGRVLLVASESGEEMKTSFRNVWVLNSSSVWDSQRWIADDYL